MRRIPVGVLSIEIERFRQLPLLQSSLVPTGHYYIAKEDLNPWVSLLRTNPQEFKAIVAEFAFEYQYNILVLQNHSPLNGIKSDEEVDVLSHIMQAWPASERFKALSCPQQELLKSWTTRMALNQNNIADKYVNLFVRLTQDMSAKELMTLCNRNEWLTDAELRSKPCFRYLQHYVQTKELQEICEYTSRFICSQFSNPCQPWLPMDLVQEIAEYAALAEFDNTNLSVIDRDAAVAAVKHASDKTLRVLTAQAESRRRLLEQAALTTARDFSEERDRENSSPAP